MPYIESNDASISYEIKEAPQQSRPWVTLINGHLRPKSDLKLLARHLHELGLQVLTFDNRGAGETKCNQPFTFVDMVRDVERLWDHLSIGTSSLVGFSMGGLISQEIAAKNRARVAKLVLVSTSIDRQDINLRQRPWPSETAAIVDDLKRYVHPNFVAKNLALLQAMAKQMAKTAGDGRLQRNATLQGQAIKQYQLSTAPFAGPTLIVHGVDDQVIPFEATARLQVAYPAAEFLDYPDSGHLLLIEKGKKLYSDIGAFLTAAV